MGISLLFTKAAPVNVALLDSELKAVGLPIEGVAFNPTRQEVRVDFAGTVTEAQQTETANVVTAHTAVDPVVTAQTDIRSRWAASAVHGKTPAEIYTAMQGAIDGWGSLAAAKADLRTWLPLMAAAIGWMVMKDEQR